MKIDVHTHLLPRSGRISRLTSRTDKRAEGGHLHRILADRAQREAEPE